MRIYILLTLILLKVGSFAQSGLDRMKAEESVMKYMALKYKNYKALTFGELFKQTRPEEILKTLGAKNQVVEYSIVHSYSIRKKEFVHDYFHLDKNYEVIGILTEAEMTKMENDILQQSGKMDSILNTIPLPD